MPDKKITPQTVGHVARLARLALSDEEIERFVPQLEKILEYIEQLKEVSVEGIEPTSHVLPLVNVYREDRVKPSLSSQDALLNAPAREGNFFKVPKVIEGS